MHHRRFLFWHQTILLEYIGRLIDANGRVCWYKAMRWKCTIAYDGTEFCGWQSQVNHNAVQDVIEARLFAIFKHFIRIHGSGRTDAGVHARGQVFHFDADWKHGSEALLRALNRNLPPAVRITRVEAVDDTFHARFSAHQKRYHYYFQPYPADPFEARYVWSVPYPKLDMHLLEEAVRCFEGTHDFRGFAGKVLSCENTVKTLTSAGVFKENNCFVLSLTGSGYLYRMVRKIMGALVMVGIEKIDGNFIEQRLRLEKLDYPLMTAPACGLFLEEVLY